jgi:hypothetical protein
MNVIQPFLHHILNIICDHDLYLYSYIINWVSFLIRKYENKPETVLVIIGELAIGKNKFFTDVILSKMKITVATLLEDLIVLLKIRY